MASIVLTISHPSLSKTQTITMPDARLVEFIDNLRNHVYGKPGTPPVALTRAQAVDKFASEWDVAIRRRYKEAKAIADAATLTPPGEIDA